MTCFKYKSVIFITIINFINNKMLESDNWLLAALAWFIAMIKQVKLNSAVVRLDFSRGNLPCLSFNYVAINRNDKDSEKRENGDDKDNLYFFWPPVFNNIEVLMHGTNDKQGRLSCEYAMTPLRFYLPLFFSVPGIVSEIA